jgi:FdhD protein
METESEMTRRAAVTPVVRVGDGATRTDQDLVAVEAPLFVTLAHPSWTDTRPLGVFMRTPGHDTELVLGFLYTERVIGSKVDVANIESRASADGSESDRLDVTLADRADAEAIVSRAQTATSACGFCGRLEVDGLDRLARHSRTGTASLSQDVIANAPGLLRAHQTVFAETGGLHGAALIDSSGAVRAVREDVGRHNAVDKLVGAALEAGWLPAEDCVLAVSGRVAYEIVYKGAMAGVAAIVSVGAPSSLAVEAARAARLTLVGFARDGRFNVYTGHERFGVECRISSS